MSRQLLIALLFPMACGGERAAPKVAEPSATATAEPAASAPVEPAASTASASAPTASASAATPAPVVELTAEMVREVVRGHFQYIGACYQAGVARDPAMKGDITVSLAIGGDGRVASADAPTTPPKIPAWKRRKQKKKPPVIYDHQVIGCVLAEFKKLSFPASKRGMVTFDYPLQFATKPSE